MNVLGNEAGRFLSLVLNSLIHKGLLQYAAATDEVDFDLISSNPPPAKFHLPLAQLQIATINDLRDNVTIVL